MPRFNFGNATLLEGVSFIPALIGMFALPEILRAMLRRSGSSRLEGPRVVDEWRNVFATVFRYRRVSLRSAAIGTGVGVLPGASADIASWISFAIARRFSREPRKWGTGHIEGVVAGSSANNASLAAAGVPALVFAIPGDTITAVAIGVLYLKGMNPGPAVFINNADLVYAVFLVFLIANLLLLPFGWLAVRIARVVLAIPQTVIMPALFVLAMVGAFAIDNDVSGIVIMVCLGVLAYLMEEAGFPIAPVVLGIVLGKLVEQNLMQSLVSAQGNLLVYFERPISAALGVATIGVWAFTLFRFAQRSWRARERRPA
jgi:TctA family transporter